MTLTVLQDISIGFILLLLIAPDFTFNSSRFVRWWEFHPDNLFLDLGHKISADVPKTVCEPVKSSRPVQKVFVSFNLNVSATYSAQVQWCSGCDPRLFLHWRQMWRRGQQRRVPQGREWQQRTLAAYQGQAPEKQGQCSPTDQKLRSPRWWIRNLLHVEPWKTTLGNEWVWDSSSGKGI